MTTPMSTLATDAADQLAPLAAMLAGSLDEAEGLLSEALVLVGSDPRTLTEESASLEDVRRAMVRLSLDPTRSPAGEALVRVDGGDVLHTPTKDPHVLRRLAALDADVRTLVALVVHAEVPRAALPAETGLPPIATQVTLKRGLAAMGADTPEGEWGLRRQLAEVRVRVNAADLAESVEGARRHRGWARLGVLVGIPALILVLLVTLTAGSWRPQEAGVTTPVGTSASPRPSITGPTAPALPSLVGAIDVGAQVPAAFANVDGSMQCMLGPTEVLCRLPPGVDQSYRESLEDTCANWGGVDGSTGLLLRRSTVAVWCSWNGFQLGPGRVSDDWAKGLGYRTVTDGVASWPLLPKGSVILANEIACQVEVLGVLCWHVPTGTSMLVSRAPAEIQPASALGDAGVTLDVAAPVDSGGVGDVRIGMTLKDAQVKGLVLAHPDGCNNWASWPVLGKVGMTQADWSSGTLLSLTAHFIWTIPEGITPTSTEADLKRAFGARLEKVSPSDPRLKDLPRLSNYEPTVWIVRNGNTFYGFVRQVPDGDPTVQEVMSLTVGTITAQGEFLFTACG